MACSSSGMRSDEALHIKGENLDLPLDRMTIQINTEYTKIKAKRTTFVSKECGEKIMTYFNKLDDNDYVFTNSTSDFKTRGRVERMTLASVLERLRYNKKYLSNGFHKIIFHSFRAYFFTLSTRKHDENYAHKMSGYIGVT